MSLLKNAVKDLQTNVTQNARGALNGSVSGGVGPFSVSAGPNGISANFNFQQVIQQNINSSLIQGELASLYKPNGGKTYRPIVFPMDLDDEHYMIYNVVERKKPSRKEQGTTRIIRSIVLPIPANLQVSYAAGYENTSLGALGAMAQGSVGAAEAKGALSDASNLISNKISAAKEAFKTNVNDAMVRTAAIGTGAAVVTGALAGGGILGGALAAGGVGGVVTGVLQNEGIAINPHLAVVFKGVDFRSFSFDYKFLARNQAESDRLKELINVLRDHMLPAYTFGTERAGFAFRYPDEFEIDFGERIKPYLFDIGTSVMTGLDVNYNGEGIPTFFEQTGAPVSIGISLKFQETRILTRNGFDDPDFQTPVGAAAGLPNSF